jgi:hypothetical protein
MEDQNPICTRYGAAVLLTHPDSIVGIALDTLDRLPLNALRHPPEGSTCGWYIWGGGELGSDPNFFKSIHASHLSECCPAILPYLSLGVGWRVLLSPGHEDVWYDPKLFDT